MDMLNGAIGISKGMLSFAESSVLKCAVELRVADIIHSHGHSITVSQIASAIDAPSPNISYLQRIMRMLVRLKIFASSQSDDGVVLYGSTPLSMMMLLHDAEISLAPMLLMLNHPLLLSMWNYLSDCVRNGGSGFKKAHGVEVFEMASANPEFNNLFNDGLQSFSKIIAKGVVSTYKDGFDSIASVVDVGGGVGQLVAEVVKAFPHITGFNFDLPHVIATAPDYSGISKVSGDMFDCIPAADAILLMHILHSWEDDDCIKILKNCLKAIPKKTGRVIIIDFVLRADGEDEELFGNLDVVFDLLMMAICPGGKERTEVEWKKILEKGGIPSYNIIHLPYLGSIIEAYPIFSTTGEMKIVSKY